MQFNNNGKQLLLIFLSKRKNNVSFNYGKAKTGDVFRGLRGKDNLQVWTQGQGKIHQ
jgi:hypothetical protein